MATFSVRLPDGTVVNNISEGTTKTQLRELYPASFVSQAPVQEETGVGGEFVKGLKREATAGAYLLNEGIPAYLSSFIEKNLGTDMDAERKTQIYQNSLNYLYSNPEFKARVDNIENIEDIGDLGDFIAGAIGQAIPNVVNAIAAGGAVSLPFKAAGAVKAAFAGGAAAQNFASIAPNELVNIYQETGEIAPNIAAGSAAAQTGLETLSDLALGGLGPLAGEFAGRGIGSLVKAGAQGAVTEGATEGVQGLISEGAQELANPEKATFNGMNVLNQAATGVAAGGPMRTATQLITGGSAPQKPTEVKEKEKTSAFASLEEELPSDTAPIETKKTETAPEAPTALLEPVLPQNQGVIQPEAQKPVKEAPIEPVSAVEAPKITRSPSPAVEEEIQQDKRVYAQGLNQYVRNLDLTKPTDQGLMAMRQGLATLSETLPASSKENVLKTVEQATNVLRNTKKKGLPTAGGFTEVDYSLAEHYDFLQTHKGPDASYKDALFTNAETVTQKKIAKLTKDSLEMVGVDLPTNILFTGGNPISSSVFAISERRATPIFANFYNMSTDADNLGGSAVFTSKDEGSGLFSYIGLNDLSKKTTPSALLTRVMPHEVGHQVFRTKLKQNPLMYENIRNAWINSLPTRTTEDEQRVLSQDLAGDYFDSIFSAENITPEGTRGRVSRIFRNNVIPEGTRLVEIPNKGSSFEEYALSFDEWFAEQFAKWYQTQEAPRNMVEQLFKDIVDVIKTFFTNLKKEFPEEYKNKQPNELVKNYIDSLVLEAKAKKIAQKYRLSPEGGIQELRAYHGSPHRFSKFLLDRIGTGEGYQAFGWGLYFTNSKDIARWYKEKLTGLTSSQLQDKKGEVVSWQDVLDFGKQNNFIEKANDVLYLRRAYDDLALEGYSGLLQSYEKELTTYPTDLRDGIRRKRDFVKLLNTLGFKKVYKDGAVYEVKLPEENEMLDWEKLTPNKVLNALPEKTQDNVAKIVKKAGITGEEFYEALIEIQGSPKAASEYLNSLGIKGVKYPAGTIAGVNSGSTNYVIFDDAAIEINSVYDDENIISALKRQEENKEADPVSQPTSPFKGYIPNINPTLPNQRSNSFLKFLANNMRKEGYVARTNAVQQYLVIFDALNTGTIDNTYFPEVFRGLLKNPEATSEANRNVVLNNKVHLTKTLDALRLYFNTPKSAFDNMNITDVMANAYRLFRMRNQQETTNGPDFAKLDGFVSKLPPAVLNTFKQMDGVSTQLKRDLNGFGVNNISQVVKGVTNDTPPALPSLMDEITNIRNLAEKEKNANKELMETAAQQTLPLGDKRNSVPGGLFGEWALIPRFIARYNPAFARLKEAADSRREAIVATKHLLFKGLNDFMELGTDQADGLGSIMDEQRKLKNRAKINPETGFLEFKRKNPETGEIKNVVLKDKNLARIYNEVQGTFQSVVLIHKNQLKRAFIGAFTKANLGVEPTRQAFENYKQQLKSGLVAQSNSLSPSQIAEVEKYFDTMESFERMLKYDYVPHSRYGTRGVTLKDAQGKTVWFGTYDTDRVGMAEADSYKETMASLENFKKSYKGTLTQSAEFDLTVNSLTKQLGANNKAMTLELLSQLLSAKNPKLFKEAMSNMRNEATDLVQGALTNKAFTTHFKEVENEDLKGYSTDWRRAISSYGNSAAYFLGNMEYEPKVLKELSRLKNDSNSSTSLVNVADKYTEELLDPTEDWASLRELQYFYAMGFNPSSALLQFQSVFTYMPATLTLATNSHIESVAALYQASKLVPLFYNPKLSAVTNGEESVYAYGDDDTHEKLVKNNKITREQSDYIKHLYNIGALQALRSADFTGLPSEVSSRSLKNKANNVLEYIKAGAGVMMRSTEETTRGMQAFAAILTMSKPENVLRLHNNLLKNDAYYQTKVEQSFSKEPDVKYMIQFLVDKALGEYGKESRSALQNSGASVTVMPFSSYPVQMLTNTYEYVGGKYGKEGQKAALWAIASTASMAGLMAVPGALAIKELIELVIKTALGEDRDLEEELRRLMTEQGVSDVVKGVVLNGVASEFLGLDIAKRMSVDVPVLTELLKMLQGEQKASIVDLLGVQGTILQIPANVLQMALEDESLPAILAKNIPNVAIQNVVKSQENKKGVTYRGSPTLLPGEAPEGAANPDLYGGETANIVKRFAGFKPLAQGEEERKTDSLLRETTRFKPALERFRAPLKKTFKQELLAKDAVEKQKVLDERNQLIQELITFMQKKGLQNINQSVNSIVKSAQLDAIIGMEGLESGAARKKMQTEARERADEIMGWYK